MSNLPKNYEKILLGVAGVAALGFAAWGFMKSSAVDTDFAFTPGGTGAKDSTIPEAVEAPKATASLKADRVLEQGLDGERPVDFFTGVALFANKNDLNTPIDPYKGEPLFPPIPNKWWLDNHADMTWSDSPNRDDDSDGFTNLEEFQAGTSPTDANSLPALIDKLVYVQDKSTMWYVKYGFESEGKWSPSFLGQTPDKKRLANRVSAENMLAVGDTFFAAGEFAGRFKFLGFVKKDVTSPRTGLAESFQFAQFEDLKPNKKGTKYESRERMPDGEIDANAYYDRTAIVELRASGNEGKTFQVEEGTKFALPPGDGAPKNYLMKVVTPGSITVEYTAPDGTTKTAEIKKGGTH